MKRYLLGSLFILLSQLAMAAEWTGSYVGINAGGVYGAFHAGTETAPGSLLDANQAALVNQLGKQNIYAKGFITGITGGYNWQLDQLFLGIESDFQSLGVDGDAYSNSTQLPGAPTTRVILSSFANNHWLFTARPRIGVVLPNGLFYLTGGLGIAYLQGDFVFSTDNDNFSSTRVNRSKIGYVIGAGVESGLSDHVSVKAEYLFANFNNSNAYQMNDKVPAGQRISNWLSLRENIVRVGLNYHLDTIPSHQYQSLIFPAALSADQWQKEIAVRPFVSNGLDGAPQPLYNGNGTQLLSRLTFSNLTAYSGELFARFDHLKGMFVKGFVGSGSITGGQLNDEDFPAGGAYSNTFSSARGNLTYANLDVGYSFLKTDAAKTGAFIGYNYYEQNIGVYGCKQEAGAAVCVPSWPLHSVYGISQQDNYNALRVGLSSLFNINEQIGFSAEVAYLPMVYFVGQDGHLLRQFVGPEKATSGDGFMLESVITYDFNPSWSLGVGARYWVWNMRTGSVAIDFFGAQSNDSDQKGAYNADRYGAFLQINYRDVGNNKRLVSSEAIHWQGVFVGGHLGGALNKQFWSDPFASTLVPGSGRTNIRGFGDKIDATGPLGGVNANANWQRQDWVYGVAASMSVADLRGQNTLFSGIGGINGEAVSHYLGTLTARLGKAYQRTLLFVDAGGAVISTKYFLNGNNGDLLGSDSARVSNWGWTAGAGIEYALTDRVSTSFEYSYIDVSRQSVAFPSIRLVNSQSIGVSQEMSLFKLGLNYRLDGLL